MEAEEKALDHVRQTCSPIGALSFLISWPALDRAAVLVIERAGDFEGAFDDILIPAADALAARHPLAATLVLRAYGRAAQAPIPRPASYCGGKSRSERWPDP